MKPMSRGAIYRAHKEGIGGQGDRKGRKVRPYHLKVK